eukprot:gene5397-6730_t
MIGESQITTKTDHKNLEHFSKPLLSQREFRWFEVLSEFKVNIEYIEGNLNLAADALSRREDYQSPLPEELIESVKKHADGNKLVNELINRKDKITITINGLHYLTEGENKRLIVTDPETIQLLISKAPDTSSHFYSKNTFHKLKTWFQLKETNSLKTLIKSYGGDVSFQITKNVQYLITTKDEFEKKSNKIQSAIKIPTLQIVTKEFIQFCIDRKHVPQSPSDYVKYLLYNRENALSSSSSSLATTTPIFDFSLLSTNENDDLHQPSSIKKKSVNLNQLELLLKKKKNVKLFISSTFLDMTKEREYIGLYLVPQLTEYCRDRGIEFSFVDMRWGITREQMKKKNMIGTCLSEVDSSNYFISILGERYGWATGKEYDDSFDLAAVYYPWMLKNETGSGMVSHRGKSITELEILQATNQFKQNPKSNCFFYFKNYSKDQETPNNNDENQDDPDLYEQDENSKVLLKSLKQKIVDSKLPLSNYTQLNDLIPIIYKNLIKQIEKDYPSENSDDTLHEVDKHLSEILSHTKVYIPNNQPIFDRLTSYVLNNEVGKPFILTGASGFGKSSLLANLVYNLARSKILDVKKTLLVHMVIGCTPNSLDRLEIIRQLYSIIKSHYQISLPIPTDPNLLLEEMSYWFDIATKEGKKLIWFLDGIEKLERKQGESVAESLDWLPTQFLGSIKLIYSVSTDSTEAMESLKKKYPNTTIETLSGFKKEEEIIKFSESFLKLYSKELDPVQKEILKKLSSPCECPLFLSTALSELVSIGTFNNLNEKLAMLLSLQFTLALYINNIQRWEEDKNYPPGLVSRILQVIYLSESGLYENEILSILNLKSSFGFFSVSRALFGGSNYFSVAGSPYLKMAIKLIYWNTPSPIVEANQSKLYQSLIDFFSSDSVSTDRKVQYLPKLFISTGSKTQFKNFLLDINHFSVLGSTETGRLNLVNYWNYIGYEKKEIVDLYKSKHSDYQRTNPPMEEFAQTTQYLASLFDILSFYEDAFNYFEIAKDYHIQLYGELNSRVCTDLLQLASLSVKISNLDKALYLSEKALNIAESVYGKDQIGCVESLRSVGLVHKKKASYQRSLEYYETALKIFSRFLGYPLVIQENNTGRAGEFNTRLGSLFNHLGDIYRKLSIHDQALLYYNRAITIYRNLRGENHPCFSELYKNLGLIDKKLGNYQSASKHYHKALDIIKSNFGEDHAEYGLILCDLADTKRKEDNYSEAENIYNRSLSILSKKLGENSVEVAEIYNNLGLIRKKLGHYNDAIQFYKKSIAIAESCLGKKHQKLSFFQHNVGDCYRKLGDYKTAEQYFSKCLSTTQDNLGNDHPEVAEILNSIGLVYKKQSKYSLAEREYKRAILIIQKSLGSDSPKIGIYTNNLADVYRKTAKYPLAKSCYQKALTNLEKSLGKNHSEYAEVLYGMGLLGMCTQEYNQAIENIEKAISITKLDLGDQHPKIGIYMNSLAEVFITREKDNTLIPEPGSFDPEKIRLLQDTASKILISDLGSEHPEMADVWMNRAEFEFQWGNHTDSKLFFANALTIIKN